MPRPSTPELIACLFLALIVVGLMLPGGGRRNDQMSPAAQLARNNLRAVLEALDHYKNEHHGTFPHDDRGPDNALYALRPYLGAKHLACTAVEDPKRAPLWDAAEARARNTGWDYLNVSDPREIAPGEVMVASRPQAFPAIMYFGDRSGTIRTRRIPSADAGRAMLGSCFTDESLVTASKAVLDEWERLGPKGHGWETTSTGSGAVLRTTHPKHKVVYEYDYSRGRPSIPRIRCSGREIRERIILDRFDRISGIQREPDDWEEVWAACAAERKE